MQAVILAAGLDRRLKELTRNNTKCMIQVNGVTLIERMLGQLEKYRLKRIVIVVGYHGHELIEFVNGLGIATQLVFVENPQYAKTNNIHFLFLAKDYLMQDDTLLLESDLIFEQAALDALIYDPRPSLALVDKYESWMDGTCMELGEDNVIRRFISSKDFRFSDIPQYYKTVNLYKFSRDFLCSTYIPFWDAYVKALGNNEYYEQVLKVILMLDNVELRAKRLHGEIWYEIDDMQDLDIASTMFAPTDEEHLCMMQSRYGGYWRYPHMLDFSYLVNTYFPPQRMMDEIKANFERLLCQYPSGMRVNSELAAKNFGLLPKHIAVGNGAAELIKAVFAADLGRVGVIRPTFEEYPNRCPKDKLVVFKPNSSDYAYTADDIMEFFSSNPIDTLILINPDNPSGSYIPREDVLRLANWAKSRGIFFILDASFSDFSDETESFMDEDLLAYYKNMLIIKSISKSYGVPGLRLGVCASADEELIDFIKKDVTIWNINSFAEFYLQIAEKYQAAFSEAIEQFREERKRFGEELSSLPGLRLIHSQANFFMCEITNSLSSRAICKELLAKHNILLKDIAFKMEGKPYVRIAIRDRKDDDRLLSALREVLS